MFVAAARRSHGKSRFAVMNDARPRLILAPALVAGILSVSVLADQFGPAPVFSTTVRGGFVVGQNATRVLSGSQTDNFPVELSWSGTVVRAIANWSYLTWASGDAGEAFVTINGVGVVGALTALTDYDTDWSFDHVASYSADVTDIVANAGPGTYVIGSAIDEPAPTFSLGEGFTIVVIYDNGGPLCHTHVYLGGINSSAASQGTGLGRMRLSPAYAGGTLHFFVNAIDGQSTLFDDFYVDSNNLSGVITGGTGGNAFVGAEGPPGNPGDVRYDRAEGDISPWISVGATELTFQTFWLQLEHDAVGHTVGAISYPALCVGDLNRDNIVGIDDLAVILAHFGFTGQAVYEDGDLNDDGDIGIADLADLLAIFGSECE
jgi:hypothetical protein